MPPTSSKRGKSGSKSGTPQKKVKTDTITIEQIANLVKELDDLSSKKFNNIAILLSYYDKLNTIAEQDIIKLRSLSFGLLKIFESLIKKSLLRLNKNSSDDVLKITKWLRSKYSNFIDQIFTYIGMESSVELLDSLKVDILEILMRLFKTESSFFAPNIDEPFFSLPIFQKLITNLLQIGTIDQISNNGMQSGNFLLLEFNETYLSKYWDLKFYFISELSSILQSITERQQQQIFYSNYLLVMKAPIYKDFEKDSEICFTSNPPRKQILKLVQFKTNFEKNWLLLLNWPLLESQYRQTLLTLHKRIIPFFQNPTNLMDFLTDSYNIGLQNKKPDSIVISILALNGLFELMKNYNLEYPNFYQNLYLILNNQLLHLPYKSRFFRMLDLFLSSTHLPSTLIASFIKRLSKLSLTAPPSGIVIIIPFIYNLLKKHPTCMILIHNTTQYTDYTDPFNNLEQDPLKTTALESSLWELNTIMNHYHPNVASLAKIFSQPFNKYSYNLEDFLDWNYTNLLNSELSKRFKGDLSLEFETFDKLLADDPQSNNYLKDWSW